MEKGEVRKMREIYLTYTLRGIGTLGSTYPGKADEDWDSPTGTDDEEEEEAY